MCSKDLSSPASPLSLHRIRECSGLEGTFVGHLVQPPWPCRVTQSRLHRTLSRQALNISREGHSTTSLDSLGQGSVTLRVKKFFLGFSWNFLCFRLCPLPLVLSLGTTISLFLRGFRGKVLEKREKSKDTIWIFFYINNNKETTSSLPISS